MEVAEAPRVLERCFPSGAEYRPPASRVATRMRPGRLEPKVRQPGRGLRSAPSLATSVSNTAARGDFMKGTRINLEDAGSPISPRRRKDRGRGRASRRRISTRSTAASALASFSCSSNRARRPTARAPADVGRKKTLLWNVVPCGTERGRIRWSLTPVRYMCRWSPGVPPDRHIRRSSADRIFCCSDT